MYSNISIAILLLIALGVLGTVNILLGKVHGTGNIAIGVVCGCAALFILMNPKQCFDISSGFIHLQDKVQEKHNDVLENTEGLTIDAKFNDFKINGHVISNIKND